MNDINGRRGGKSNFCAGRKCRRNSERPYSILRDASKKKIPTHFKILLHKGSINKNGSFRVNILLLEDPGEEGGEGEGAGAG